MMKRLLNKKGSVLFLVVVVMSILIIAASATFYIVNNQRSSANVRYSSEQSYQTAVSVSDTVSKYIDGYLEAISKSGKDLSAYSDTLIGKMMKLTVGGSSDITSNIDFTDYNMGEAKVTITKTKQIQSPANPENTSHIFEVTTKSDYNGETIAVTEVKEIVTGPSDYFTRFLTSTGNRPEDVVFQCGELYSDAYFENDYTDFGGGATNIRNSIYATGTFIDNGIGYGAKTGSNEMVIGENFYVLSAGGGGSGSTVDVDYIFVRGNMTVKSGANKPFISKDIYVLGDLILDGDIGSNPTNFFVSGNLYINTHTGTAASFYVGKNLYVGSAVSGALGTFVVNGDIELASNCNGSAVSMKCAGNITDNSISYANFDPVQDSTVGALITTAFADSATAGSPVSDWSEVSKYIITKTKANKYEDWDAEGYFIKKLSAAPTIDLANAPTLVTWEDNHYGKYSNDNITVERYSRHNDKGWGNTLVTIKKSCKLIPVTGYNWQALGSGGETIVFDATSSDLYIYLDSNGMTDSNGKKLFSFFNSGQGTNLLIRGTHSVIFILPSDTNFKMNTQQFIGHEAFALYLSGKTSVKDIAETGAVVYSYDNSATEAKITPALETVAVGGTNATIMKQSTVGANAHNNIFLVTTGKTRDASNKLTSTFTNNYVDFNIASGFSGYIYAPCSELLCNGGYSGLQFFGGLIVGTYTYKNPSAMLAFTTPYDYADIYKGAGETNYKKTDIVKRLINFANSDGVPGGSSAGSTLQSFGTLGYK